METYDAMFIERLCMETEDSAVSLPPVVLAQMAPTPAVCVSRMIM